MTDYIIHYVPGERPAYTCESRPLTRRELLSELDRIEREECILFLHGRDADGDLGRQIDAPEIGCGAHLPVAGYRMLSIPAGGWQRHEYLTIEEA